MIFSAIALSIGAAFSMVFGGALLAGAMSTAMFALAVAGVFWVGMLLTVAVPVMIGIGAIGAFAFWNAGQGRLSPEEARKRAQQVTDQAGRRAQEAGSRAQDAAEQARRRAQEITEQFGGTYSGQFPGMGRVIDVQAKDVVSEEEAEAQTTEREDKQRKKEVEQELADFDARFRQRVVD